MDLLTIQSELMALANEKRQVINVRHGAQADNYGVLRGALRKISSRIKTNHELAISLWNTGNLECQWLACSAFDPSKFSLQDIESSLSGLVFNDLIDKFTVEVIAKTEFSQEIFETWKDASNDTLGRVAWRVRVVQINADILSDEELQSTLDYIHAHLVDALESTQWTMNHALCAIGIRFEKYREACIEMGRELGVYQDMKVSKGCTSAYAPEWIQAVVS